MILQAGVIDKSYQSSGWSFKVQDTALGVRVAILIYHTFCSQILREVPAMFVAQKLEVGMVWSGLRHGDQHRTRLMHRILGPCVT